MKKLLWVMTAMMALTFLVATGCAKKELDYTRVEAAFQKDTDADKTLLQNGLALAKAGDYPKAIESLQKVAYGAHLSKEQREALQDLMRELRARKASK